MSFVIIKPVFFLLWEINISAVEKAADGASWTITAGLKLLVVQLQLDDLFASVSLFVNYLL